MHAILSSVYPVESISTIIPDHQFHDMPVPSHALRDRRHDSNRGNASGMGSPRLTCTRPGGRAMYVMNKSDFQIVQRCKGPLVLPLALYRIWWSTLRS